MKERYLNLLIITAVKMLNIQSTIIDSNLELLSEGKESYFHARKSIESSSQYTKYSKKVDSLEKKQQKLEEELVDVASLFADVCPDNIINAGGEEQWLVDREILQDNMRASIYTNEEYQDKTILPILQSLSRVNHELAEAKMMQDSRLAVAKETLEKEREKKEG